MPTPARFPKMEVRAAVEVRAAPGRRLEGYACVFGVEARIADFVEVVRAGAFTDSLRTNGDILMLFDHSAEKVLARTAAGNLVLMEDARGLAFTASLPDTSTARDAWSLVESRTAGGCSFGFRPVTERWSGQRRELVKIDLVEISLVSAFPAYPQTSVAARARAASPDAVAAARRRRAYLATL